MQDKINHLPLSVQQMHVLIVFNMLAARARQSRIRAVAEAFADAGHDVAKIDSYAAELPDRAAVADCICIVGGDGTVRDVMARLDDLPTPARFAVYPLGTINLIAREAGYVTDYATFVERATSAEAPNQFHTVKMNDGLMLVCASVGPDSAAVASVSPQMKRQFGRFAYLISALKMLYRWPRHSIEVLIDGAPYQCEAAYLLNGKYYAGPWCLDSIASLRTPSVQVLMLPKARRRDYLRLIGATILHPVFADSRWQRRTGCSVELRSPSPLPVQADGDITATLPVSLSVRPTTVAFG
jgi:diacylglycerol kinase family enzyme